MREAHEGRGKPSIALEGDNEVKNKRKAVGETGKKSLSDIEKKVSQAGSTPLAPHRFFAAGIARRDDGVLMTDRAVKAPTAEDAITLAQFVACQPGWCGAWAYAAMRNPRGCVAAHGRGRRCTITTLSDAGG